MGIVRAVVRLWRVPCDLLSSVHLTFLRRRRKYHSKESEEGRVAGGAE